MNVWYINIITYFIFRYLLRTYYDNNIKSKVIFSIYSTYVIYCMDYNRWVINERKFSVEDRIDIAHQYSKEVEHSQENIDYLEEEFVFDEKNIQKMLSGFLNT